MQKNVTAKILGKKKKYLHAFACFYLWVRLLGKFSNVEDRLNRSKNIDEQCIIKAATDLSASELSVRVFDKHSLFFL